MKRWRWITAVMILLPIGWLVFQLSESFRSQREGEVEPGQALDMLPQAVQMIQDFHRVEIRDGQKVWEVEAEEAQYLEESDQIFVRSPRASFFLDDGSEVRVVGREGKIRLVNRDLKRVHVRDNVEVHVRDFVIRVPGAVYDRDHSTIVTRGPVHIVGDQLELRGRGMRVDVDTSSFTIEEAVRVTLRGASSVEAPAS